jgi:hypothetical protein
MKYQHDLKVQYLPIGAIKPDPRNARTHSKKQVEQIAASIHYGMRISIDSFNEETFERIRKGGFAPG